MRVLAVDTTTPSGSVAVLQDGRVLGEIGLESPSTHSVRLLSSIDFLLRGVGIDIREIEGFALVPGPGSFTGIRIGLSTVKSFAFASGKRTVLVSSLMALAWKVLDSRARLAAPMLDAKKGEIYAALFENRRGRPVAVVPQGAYLPEEFLALLPPRRVVHFIGSGTGLCRQKIEDLLKDRARFSTRSPFIAAEVGLLGTAILRAGRGVSSEAIEPLYFRISQAEEKHQISRRR